MRFICDSCRAQYMISDEKVGAKGVKVRCKKCGYVILVRRTDAAGAGAPPVTASEPPPPPGSDDDGLATQVMNNPLEGLASSTMPGDGDATNPGQAPEKKANGNVLGGVDEDEIGAVFDSVLNSGAHKIPDGAKTVAEQQRNGEGALGEDDDDDRMNTRVLDADTVKKLAQEAGGALAPSDKPPAPDPANQEWFVAIDEKQVGPLSLDKVKDYWSRGEVGPDSLCWRAGFSDWMPLSEVAELASVLAPRPSKPVIVASASVGPVVSVPVESSFNSGGVTKTVRTEVQVPLAAAPPEETLGGWKPSAASALASLVKEEIEALTKPPPRSDVPISREEPVVAKGGLLDLPPMDEKPEGSGKPNGARHEPSSEPARPMAAAPAYGTPVSAYGAPPVSVYRPAPRRGMWIGLGVGGVLLLVVLVGLVVYFATKSSSQTPVVAQPVTATPTPPPAAAAPPPVAAAPAATASTAAASTPAPAPAPVAAPAAAAPAPAAPAVAAAPAPAPTPAPRERTRLAPAARREDRGEVIAAAKPAPAAREDSRPAAPAPSGGDDEFAEVFGGPKNTPKNAPVEKKKKSDVYIPPAPGSGASDLPESLSQSAIMETVVNHRTALLRCGEEQKKREPGTSGKLIMRWTILTSGKTANVSVVSEELKSSYMAGCVGALIKGWTFPKHRVQGDPVTFPFKF